jgi:hypothetical protein
MTTPTTVPVRLKLRQDTAANWTSVNPTLLAGELGRESDTGKIKIGNGSSTWTALAYQPFGSSITNADIAANAAIVDTKLATIATAGKVSNSATTADSANTASAIVARDASGNFAAGTITAALTGAASANVLKAGDTMTGALLHPLGTAAAPSIAFTGDTNTGIFSPGADQVAVATNGGERLRITSAGLVGIGTSAPAQLLHVLGSNTSTGSNAPGLVIQQSGSGDATLNFITTGVARYQAGIDQSDSNKFKLFYDLGGDFSGSGLTLDASGRLGIGTTSPGSALEINADAATSPFIAKINTAEVARIDSSGRLLVGTSSYSGTAKFLVQGGISQGGGVLGLQRGDVAAVNGSNIGFIEFSNNANNLGATLAAVADGTWSSGTSHPTRLVFSTTADGASSPTERLRITSAGVLQIADAGNISVGTTTGTKIGTATTQKLGFYNATPVVQPAAVANATDAATVITQLNDLLAKLRTLGIIAT